MASYYKRKNGTYCVRVSNGMKNGKQELISATYKPPIGITASAEAREVKQFADLFEAAVHNGMYIPGMKSDSTKTNAFGMTVGEFIQNHYFKRIEAKLSPNTVRFYRMITEQFIIPSFENIRLTDITAKHLQAFIHYLSSSGSRADEENKTPLSAATVKRYATVFSSVMTEACKMGYTEENKLRKASVEYPKIFRKTLEVYNDEEVRQFFHALQKEPPQIKAMLLCALLLGLRRGEIVALQWSDIDFDKGTLSVNKSAYKNKGESQKLKPPKSQTSVRTVFFPIVFAKALNEWKAEQEIERKKAGARWKEQDFIFTNSVGDMISLYAPTEICSDFEKRHHLHHLKLHGLRHTCGSLLVGNGVDPETVKSILGHDSLETTNLYIHPYVKNMKNAADLLGKIVANGESGVTV